MLPKPNISDADDARSGIIETAGEAGAQSSSAPNGSSGNQPCPDYVRAQRLRELMQQATSRERRSEPPQQTAAVASRDEARTRELFDLKLALAAFAVQLDAFEARIRTRTIPKSAAMDLGPIDRGFADQIVAAMKRSPAVDRTRDIQQDPRSQRSRSR
jgi:hypothetical protein